MFFHLLQIQENKNNRKSHWCSNRLHQHHKDLLRTHQYLNKNRGITFILKAESNWFSLSSLSNTLIILKNNLPLSSLSPPLIYLLSLHQISQVIDAFDTKVILYLRGTSLTRKMKHCEVISPRSIHKVIDDSNQSPHQLRLTQLETIFGFVTIGGNSTRQLTITDYPTSCKPVFTSAIVRSVFVGTNRIFVTRAAIL